MAPRLSDEQAVQAATRLRLRDPRGVLRSDVLRAAVEAAWWALERAHARRLQRAGRPSTKVAASGDAPF